MGKALYRKYRSTKLADIVGQEHIVGILENALRTGKINHAYLFTGPRGVGKTSIARILAHEINKFPYEVEDQYTDIIEIDAASNTGVDNIRNLIDNAPISPTKGKYKIYIIDEVHMLSKSAFNALLKTLEEPPAHVIFIMATTETHKIPATILSRSQQFHFKLADQPTMIKHLQEIAEAEKVNIEHEALVAVAQSGGGSFRDSISLLDQIATVAGDGRKITKQDVEQLLGVAPDEIITGIIEGYERQDMQVLALLSSAFEKCLDAKVITEKILEKIIEAPNGARLQLAEKLVQVLDSPSPKVKLMATLLSFAEAQSLKSSNSRPATVQKTIAKKAEMKATDGEPEKAKEETKIENAVENKETEVEEVAEEKQDVAKLANIPGAGCADKASILEFVRKKSVPLYSLLDKVDFEFADSKLMIFVASAFAKKKIDKMEYRKMIAEAVGGSYNIVIDTKRPASDETVAKIANIMGGGEEIALSE